MVIEMLPPKGGLLSLFDFARSLAVYGLSYFTLITLWIHHHFLFSITKTINTKIIWYNFLHLFFMTIIPIPTDALGEEFQLKLNHIFYGSVMCANMICLFLPEYQVYRSVFTGVKKYNAVSLKTLLIILLYFVSIAASFVNVYLSIAIFLLNPLLYTYLTRSDRKIL